MNLGIKNKRVLITGGTRGIGREITRTLASEGAKVVVISRSERLLQETINEIGGIEKGHGYTSVDLLKKNNAKRTVKKLLDMYGKIDIVIHNVGGALGIKDLFCSVDDWNKVWYFNVGIAIEMNALIIPEMIKNNWGRIVHISSISAKLGELSSKIYGGAIPYAASKAYLNSYVRNIAREFASYNIIISAIMPGAIKSENKFWDKLSKTNPDLVKRYLDEHQAIKRFGSPDEIAPFVSLLASEKASFACGSIIEIDGGRY